MQGAVFQPQPRWLWGWSDFDGTITQYYNMIRLHTATPYSQYPNYQPSDPQYPTTFNQRYDVDDDFDTGFTNLDFPWSEWQAELGVTPSHGSAFPYCITWYRDVAYITLRRASTTPSDIQPECLGRIHSWLDYKTGEEGYGFTIISDDFLPDVTRHVGHIIHVDTPDEPRFVYYEVPLSWGFLGGPNASDNDFYLKSMTFDGDDVTTIDTFTVSTGISPGVPYTNKGPMFITKGKNGDFYALVRENAMDGDDVVTSRDCIYKYTWDGDEFDKTVIFEGDIIEYDGSSETPYDVLYFPRYDFLRDRLLFGRSRFDPLVDDGTQRLSHAIIQIDDDDDASTLMELWNPYVLVDTDPDFYFPISKATDVWTSAITNKLYINYDAGARNDLAIDEGRFAYNGLWEYELDEPDYENGKQLMAIFNGANSAEAGNVYALYAATDLGPGCRAPWEL